MTNEETPGLDALIEHALYVTDQKGPRYFTAVEGRQALAELASLKAALRAGRNAVIEENERLREVLKRALTAVGVALHRHEQAIAMARAEGAFVPEEFGEREADVFRIAIREGRAALPPPTPSAEKRSDGTEPR